MVTWLPFVITGMALGRLDLGSGTVQRRLAAFGPALVVLGYGTSLLLAGKDALRSAAEDGSSSLGSGSAPPNSGSFPDMQALDAARSGAGGGSAAGAATRPTGDCGPRERGSAVERRAVGTVECCRRTLRVEPPTFRFHVEDCRDSRWSAACFGCP